MNKPINTTIDFEFCDGTTTQLTLSFYAIYQLKSKNPALYGRYTRAMASMGKGNTVDELETIAILYVAYMCAHMNDTETMSEEEFIMMCGSDRIAVANAVKALTQPKKQMVSSNRS